MARRIPENLKIGLNQTQLGYRVRLNSIFPSMIIFDEIQWTTQLFCEFTSTSTGFCCCTTISRAARMALYTARASFPSTRMLRIPYACPFTTTPSPAHKMVYLIYSSMNFNVTASGMRMLLLNWSEIGVLIAHPLLRHMNITGASITAAKFIAAWKSPCTQTSISTS